MLFIMNANAVGYHKDKAGYEATAVQSVILPIKVQSYDRGYHYFKVVGQSKGHFKVKPLSIGDREQVRIQAVNVIPFASCDQVIIIQ